MPVGSVAQGKINAEIILRLEKLKTGQAEAKAIVTKMSADMAKVGKKGAKEVSAAWAAGFAIISVVALKMARKVTAAFGDMINVYAGFEQSLANTQSVARASAEELDKMEAAARRVGATTRSTASQAANALYYLASAGFTATESIAALDGVNALAIATQSDLAKTTETVAVTIRQYNLETSAATDIANTFTAAITNSLATMQKLTKSFEYVGPIAAGLGKTVEETTGALQLLYNKGFSGEKAGRGLRSILVDLADATSVVNKKLSRMGIQFDDVNPATNKLADIFDHLRENSVDATNAAAIFGKVSGVQLASLISVASDAKGGLNELTEAVTGTQRAFEAMEIQMNTLKGSMDKFKNAEEALKISIGKGLDPALTALVDIGTEFVKGLNAANPLLLSMVTVITTVAAVATIASIAFTALNLALGAAHISLTAALALVGAIALPLTVAGVAVVGFVAGLAELQKISLKNLDEQFGRLADGMALNNDEMKLFVHTASKVAKSAGMISKKDLMDVASLRIQIKKLSEEYEVTIDQALEMAKASTVFSEKAGITIGILEEELRAEKALREERKEAIEEAMRDRQKYNDMYTNWRISAAKYEDEEQAREDRISDTQDALTVKFARIAEESKHFGESFDENAAFLDAFNAGAKELISLDVKVASETFRLYVEEWKRLSDLYDVILPKSESFAENIEWRNAYEPSEYVIKLKELNEAQELIGKTALEVLEVQEERALANIDLTEDEITAIKNYFKMAKKLQKIRNEDDAIAKTKDYRDQIEALTMSEVELINVERDRAIESVLASDMSTEAMEKLIDAINKLYDDLEDTAALEAFQENFETVTDYIVDALSAISDYTLLAIEQEIEAQERLLQTKLDAIDAAHQAQLDALDEEEQAALEAAGVQEKTALELAQEKVDAAHASGDAIKIKEAEDALARLVIQEAFDAERLALKEAYEAEKTAMEEEAANKLKELQYEAAMIVWKVDMLKAIASTANAILKTFADFGWPAGIVPAAIMAGIGSVQIATIERAKPKKFDSGGVVPGSSYKGDTVPILANSGELILNKAQQSNVANKLDDNRPIQITTNFVLDGKIVATNSAKYYRNGQVKL